MNPRDATRPTPPDPSRPAEADAPEPEGQGYAGGTDPWWQPTGREPRLAAGPFKYLDYFTEGDHRLFEGRMAAVESMVSGILRADTFVLYGASGAGKTSLLLAGVFPELRARALLPVYVRTLDDPTEDLLAALRDLVDDPDVPDDPERLLERLSRDRGVVLALDQFEEFFVRFSDEPERRRAFTELLGRMLRSGDADVRIVFSLRQEWLADLDDFKEELPDLFEHELRLRSLSAFGARQALSRQLQAAGIAYEPALLLDLVDRLEPYGFDPTILQILGSSVYRVAVERDPDDPFLRASDLESLGEIRSVFEDFLDSFFLRVPRAQHVVACAVLDALTTRKRTKQALRAGDVAGRVIDAEEEEVTRILRLLGSWGLVREDRRGGEAWYELVHERLVGVVNDWLDRNSDFFDFRLARELATSPLRTEASVTGALLSEAQLTTVVGPQKDRLVLDPGHVEFLVRSSMVARSRTALETWAPLLDQIRLEEVVSDALDAPEAARRAGAAWALRWLDADRFFDRLGRVVTGDPAAEARNAAAETLAASGRRHEVQLLFEAEKSGMATGAFDGLVEFYRAGGRLVGVPLTTRIRVGREARRRGGRALRGMRRRLYVLGWRVGAAGSVVWSLTVGLLLLLASWWASGEPASGEGTFFSFAAGGIAGTVVWGGFSGGAFALAASRRLMARPSESWLSLVGRAWNVRLLGATVVVVGSLYGLSSLMYGAEPTEAVAAIVLIYLLALSIKYLLGVLVRMVLEPAPRPLETRGLGLPVLLASMGLPILIPLGLAALFFLGEANSTLAGWPVVAGVLSVSLVVLARVGRAVEVELGLSRERGEPARRPRLGRRLLHPAALVAPLLFPLILGLDTLPFPILHPVQSVDEPIQGRLSPVRPDADFHRVRTSETELAVLSASVEPLVDLWVRLNGPILTSQSQLVVPGGEQWIGVETDDAAARHGVIEYEVLLDASPVVRGPVDLDQVESSTFVELSMERSPPGREFSCLQDTEPFPAYAGASGRGDPAGGVGGRVYRAEIIGQVPGEWLDARDLHVELQPLRANYLARSTGSGDLCIRSEGARVGDASVLWFQSTPTQVDLLNAHPIPIDSTGGWRAEVELRLNVRRPSILGLSPEERTAVPILLAVSVHQDTDPLELWTDALRLSEEAREREGPAAIDPAAGEIYRRLAELWTATTSHERAGRVCRTGALDGFAQAIIPVCDRAVELAPGIAWVRESRGIARAMGGWGEGARDDFAAAAKALDADAVERRLLWIRRLDAGLPPEDLFGVEERARLRSLDQATGRAR